MGRHEALEVSALGRSPYDEEVIKPLIPSRNNGILEDGQQYDDRGHPINPATRRRIRDHVRASNEVMQAAGIIEETAEIRARDRAVAESIQEEEDMGVWRLEAGRLILVAGVWGVCGLRRRILLYKTYASTDILTVLRGEKAHHSLRHLAAAGLPSLWAYQAVEWVGFLVRAITYGPYRESSNTSEDSRWRYWAKWSVHHLLDFGIEYVMIQYQMFAILQQLNLISSNRLFPSNRSLIPFSAHSPFQLPPHPTSLRGLLPWSRVLLHSATPMLAIHTYIKTSAMVSAIIFSPIYRSLPRPLNTKLNSPTTPSNPPENAADQSAQRSTSDPNPQSTATDPSVTTHRLNTLSSLEGRPPSPSPDTASFSGPTPLRHNSFPNDDFNDGRDNDEEEEEQTTLISLDFEATEMPDSSGGGSGGGAGEWSAELRSAEPLKQATYRITTYTMLPPLLAADALSGALSAVVMLPFEAVMVRIVAGAWRRSAGMDAEDLLGLGLGFGTMTGSGWRGILKGLRFSIPWRGLVNLVVVQAAEVVLAGVVWMAFTTVNRWIGGKEEEWRKVREEGDTSEFSA